MRTFCVFAAAALVVGTARGAFMVEGHSTGKATANFSSLGHSETATPSTAAGKQATGSVFGNPTNATGPDQYTFSYTPGVDLDNTTFGILTFIGDTLVIDADGLGPTAPTYTDETLFSSTATGGDTGLYNVFITWPASANVNAAGSMISVTNDSAAVELNPLNMNTDQSEAAPTGSSKFGGNNAWLKIASGVPLTQGNTYTVTVTANAATFVSQRVHGVMWEPIPEPSSLALLGIAGISALRRRRGA